jgi:nucleoside diphosphate kinase
MYRTFTDVSRQVNATWLLGPKCITKFEILLITSMVSRTALTVKTRKMKIKNSTFIEENRRSQNNFFRSIVQYTISGWVDIGTMTPHAKYDTAFTIYDDSNGPGSL